MLPLHARSLSDTQSGERSSRKSLTIEYDTSPPAFQLLRSIRQGNIPLAALVIALVLAHGLAIAFAGMFSAISVEFTDPSYSGAVFPTFGISGPIQGQSLEMYYILADHLDHDFPLPTFVTNDFFVLDFNIKDGRDDIEMISGPTHGVGINVSCGVVEPDKVHLSCDQSSGLSVPSVTYCPDSYFVALDDACWPHPLRDGSISSTQEVMLTSGDFFIQSANCSSTFFAMWAERPADPNPPNTNTSSLYLPRLDSVILKCTTVENIVDLHGMMTVEGDILGSDITRVFSAEEVTALYPAYTKSSDRLPQSFIESIRQGILADTDFDDQYNMVWFDYLATTIDSEIVRTLTNITHIPHTTGLANAFEIVYRQLFAITIGLNQGLLFHGDPVSMDLPTTLLRNRVTMNTTMYAISVGILGFIMVVLVLLYWGRRGGRFDGHLPISLGTMYALLYASTAKNDCGEVLGENPKERERALDDRGHRYAFKSFVVDGKRHVGVDCVDCSPFVNVEETPVSNERINEVNEVV